MTIYNQCATDIHGNQIDFKQFVGKVLLIVNTASECGLTSQFEQLQQLHNTYKNQGLVVVGFPCNQFGAQEPQDEPNIHHFCQSHYGVDFLMMSKVLVNGDNAHPLFAFLKKAQGGVLTDAIKWNFTKFLVSKEGVVLARYAPTTSPLSLEQDIQQALEA